MSVKKPESVVVPRAPADVASVKPAGRPGTTIGAKDVSSRDVLAREGTFRALSQSTPSTPQLAPPRTQTADSHNSIAKRTLQVRTEASNGAIVDNDRNDYAAAHLTMAAMKDDPRLASFYADAANPKAPLALFLKSAKLTMADFEVYLTTGKPTRELKHALQEFDKTGDYPWLGVALKLGHMQAATLEVAAERVEAPDSKTQLKVQAKIAHAQAKALPTRGRRLMLAYSMRLEAQAQTWLGAEQASAAQRAKAKRYLALARDTYQSIGNANKDILAERPRLPDDHPVREMLGEAGRGEARVTATLVLFEHATKSAAYQARAVQGGAAPPPPPPPPALLAKDKRTQAEIRKASLEHAKGPRPIDDINNETEVLLPRLKTDPSFREQKRALTETSLDLAMVYRARLKDPPHELLREIVGDQVALLDEATRRENELIAKAEKGDERALSEEEQQERNRVTAQANRTARKLDHTLKEIASNRADIEGNVVSLAMARDNLVMFASEKDKFESTRRQRIVNALKNEAASNAIDAAKALIKLASGGGVDDDWTEGERQAYAEITAAEKNASAEVDRLAKAVNANKQLRMRTDVLAAAVHDADGLPSDVKTPRSGQILAQRRAQVERIEKTLSLAPAGGVSSRVELAFYDNARALEIDIVQSAQETMRINERLVQTAELRHALSLRAIEPYNTAVAKEKLDAADRQQRWQRTWQIDAASVASIADPIPGGLGRTDMIAKWDNAYAPQLQTLHKHAMELDALRRHHQATLTDPKIAYAKAHTYGAKLELARKCLITEVKNKALNERSSVSHTALEQLAVLGVRNWTQLVYGGATVDAQQAAKDLVNAQTIADEELALPVVKKGAPASVSSATWAQRAGAKFTAESNIADAAAYGLAAAKRAGGWWRSAGAADTRHARAMAIPTLAAVGRLSSSRARDALADKRRLVDVRRAQRDPEDDLALTRLREHDKTFSTTLNGFQLAPGFAAIGKTYALNGHALFMSTFGMVRADFRTRTDASITWTSNPLMSVVDEALRGGVAGMALKKAQGQEVRSRSMRQVVKDGDDETFTWARKDGERIYSMYTAGYDAIDALAGRLNATESWEYAGLLCDLRAAQWADKNGEWVQELQRFVNAHNGSPNDAANIAYVAQRDPAMQTWRAHHQVDDTRALNARDLKTIYAQAYDTLAHTATLVDKNHGALEQDTKYLLLGIDAGLMLLGGEVLALTKIPGAVAQVSGLARASSGIRIAFGSGRIGAVAAGGFEGGAMLAASKLTHGLAKKLGVEEGSGLMAGIDMMPSAMSFNMAGKLSAMRGLGQKYALNAILMGAPPVIGDVLQLSPDDTALVADVLMVAAPALMHGMGHGKTVMATRERTRQVLRGLNEPHASHPPISDTHLLAAERVLNDKAFNARHEATYGSVKGLQTRRADLIKRLTDSTGAGLSDADAQRIAYADMAQKAQEITPGNIKELPLDRPATKEEISRFLREVDNFYERVEATLRQAGLPQTLAHTLTKEARQTQVASVIGPDADHVAMWLETALTTHMEASSKASMSRRLGDVDAGTERKTLDILNQEIRGELRDDIELANLLRRLLPANGSVEGIALFKQLTSLLRRYPDTLRYYITTAYAETPTKEARAQLIAGLGKQPCIDLLVHAVETKAFRHEPSARQRLIALAATLSDLSTLRSLVDNIPSLFSRSDLSAYLELARVTEPAKRDALLSLIEDAVNFRDKQRDIEDLLLPREATSQYFANPSAGLAQPFWFLELLTAAQNYLDHPDVLRTLSSLRMKQGFGTLQPDDRMRYGKLIAALAHRAAHGPSAEVRERAQAAVAKLLDEDLALLAPSFSFSLMQRMVVPDGWPLTDVWTDTFARAATQTPTALHTPVLTAIKSLSVTEIGKVLAGILRQPALELLERAARQREVLPTNLIPLLGMSTDLSAFTSLLESDGFRNLSFSTLTVYLDVVRHAEPWQRRALLAEIARLDVSPSPPLPVEGIAMHRLGAPVAALAHIVLPTTGAEIPAELRVARQRLSATIGDSASEPAALALLAQAQHYASEAGVLRALARLGETEWFGEYSAQDQLRAAKLIAAMYRIGLNAPTVEAQTLAKNTLDQILMRDPPLVFDDLPSHLFGQARREQIVMARSQVPANASPLSGTLAAITLAHEVFHHVNKGVATTDSATATFLYLMDEYGAGMTGSWLMDGTAPTRRAALRWLRQLLVDEEGGYPQLRALLAGGHPEERSVIAFINRFLRKPIDLRSPDRLAQVKKVLAKNEWLRQIRDPEGTAPGIKAGLGFIVDNERHSPPTPLGVPLIR